MKEEPFDNSAQPEPGQAASSTPKSSEAVAAATAAMPMTIEQPDSYIAELEAWIALPKKRSLT